MPTQLHLAENAWNPYANVPLLVRGPGPQGPGTGPTFINRAKYSQKATWLRASAYPTTLAANARARASISPMSDQGGSGDTEFYYWWATSTSKFAVMLTNLAMGNTKLMNQPVEASLIFGNGPQLPGRLLQPVFVSATNSLDCELVDLSGSSNTIRILGMGCQIVDPMNTLGVTQDMVRAAMFNPNVVPYWLTFDTGAEVTAAANTTTSFTMTVPSDGDFNAWALCARAETAADLTIEILEGNSRRLMDGTPLLAQVASVTSQTASLNAASIPFIFPFTHTFQRKTQITVRVTNAGAAQLLSMCWWGQLAYYPVSPPGLAIAGTGPVVAQRVAPAFVPMVAPRATDGLSLRGWR